MQPVQFFAVNHLTGAVLPNATITVWQSGTGQGTLAQLYSDAGVTAIANPTSADSNGKTYFYSGSSPVDIQIASGSYSAPLILNVSVADPADQVAAAAASASSASASASSASSSASWASTSAVNASSSASSAATSATNAQTGAPNRNAVRLISTSNLAGTYANGTAGVGATITLTATGVLTVDGKTVNLNDDLIVAGQTAQLQNGFYTCTTAGATGVSAVLTRRVTENTPSTLGFGCALATDGTTLAGYGYRVATDPATITIGTTAISVVQSMSPQGVAAEASARQAQVAPIAAQVVSPVPLGSDGYLPIMWDLDGNKVMDWSPIWGYRVFGLKSSDLQAAINALSAGAMAASVVTIADAGAFFQTKTSVEAALQQLGASTYLYNWNPAFVPKWRQALARVKAKTGYATAVEIGDSLTSGAGSSLYTQAYPHQLMLAESSSYLPVIDNGIVGTNTNSGADYGAPYDPRISYSGWHVSSNGGESLGGYFFVSTTPGSVLHFTPDFPFDSYDVYYQVATNAGVLSTDIGGSTLATINQNGAAGYAKLNVPCTLGNNTINFTHVSGTIVSVLIVAARNSAAPAVEMLKAGRYAAKIADLSSTSTPWAMANALTVVAPDLTLIKANVNDINATSTNLSSEVAAYKTAYQALINKAKLSGDVIMVIDIPSNTANSSGAVGAAYRLACYQLADTNQCPLIDLNKRYTSYTVSSPLYYSDGIHQIPAGYCDMAQAIRPIFKF